MRICGGALGALLCVASTSRVVTGPGDAPAQAAMPVVRNPQRLRASEILERRQPGAARKVRFEWDHVPSAREYVLTGQWANAVSWAIHSREYRVTPRNATKWDGRRVAFDASIPEGNHSWKLVAIFGPRDAGDFENPTALSFDVR